VTIEMVRRTGGRRQRGGVARGRRSCGRSAGDVRGWRGRRPEDGVVGGGRREEIARRKTPSREEVTHSPIT
jgi:hypothetical protein